MKKLSRAFTALLFATSVCVFALCAGGCTEESAAKSKSKSKKPAFNYSQTKQSDDEFQKGAERPPTADTLYALAELLIAQGNDAHAELVLRRLTSEYPKFIPAYNSLAELEMRQRKIDEAMKALNDGLELSPDDPVLINNRGMCWMVRQDYRKALADFTKAAGLMPENARYRANMAVALAFLGRDEEALSLYKQILPEDKAKHNLDVIQQARKK
jgi:Flp pilus assembly protein TadD